MRQKRSYSPGARHPALSGLFLYVETLLYCLEIRFGITPKGMRPLSHHLIRTRKSHGSNDFNAFQRPLRAADFSGATNPRGVNFREAS